MVLLTKYLLGEKKLLNVVAKVSTRFKALASIKSFWKGYVTIMENTEWKLAKECLNDGITSLFLLKREVKSDDIAAIAAKCPNLTVLNVHALMFDTWPTLLNPLASLKVLTLTTWDAPSDDTLKDLKLHQIFPNLEVFHNHIGAWERRYAHVHISIQFPSIARFAPISILYPRNYNLDSRVLN